MKKNLFKSFLILASGAFLVAGPGCKKLEDFGDTNVNPNGSPDVLTSALLTNVEAGLGARVAELNSAHFSQIYAEPTYPGNSVYVLPQFNFAGFYSGPLMDLQVIINRNSNPATAGAVSVDGDNANQIAIARILKAYTFWTLTDQWGDIPYSEALQGTANLTPKYDEQEFIYMDLLKELEEAKDQMTTGGTAIRGDIMYNGNMDKWKRLSNTLRMLISLRMSKVYPAPGDVAAVNFDEAANDPAGYIATNADNFTLDYPGGNYRNTFNNYAIAADNRTSKTMTDLVTGLNDPRSTAFFSNNSGVPYGLAAAAPTTVDYGKILSPTFHAPDAEIVVINAASALLAHAEAAFLGWTSGDPKTLYNAGVTASFAQWGVTLPGNYLTSGPANYDTGAGVASIGGSTVPGSNALTASPLPVTDPNYLPPTDPSFKLKRIHLQQFLAFYPSGIQTWSNWRRTGVPDLRPTIEARGGDGIPRRFVYGTTEQNLNSAQMNIAVARIPGGVDDQDARVWWDRP